MRIAFVDTYYSKFSIQFYKKARNYKDISYEDLKRELLKTCFGTSDFYSYNLKKLGHEAEDFIVNDELLQRKWAQENNIVIKNNPYISKIQLVPFMYRLFGKPKWVQDIVFEQIKRYKPDVVYVQDLSILNTNTLMKIKQYCKLLVGQIASPLPPLKYLRFFDLIISSFPHYVKFFNKIGLKSEYQKLAFEPRILKKIGKQKKIYDVVFIGSFTPYHKQGIKILERLCKEIPIDVWGQGIEFVSPLSPIRKRYHGDIWGLDMYKVLSQSIIAINRHIGVAKNYANNMRLYEVTGMGTLLITDHKKNLNDIFKVDKEIVSYKNEKDLIKSIKYFLRNDIETEKISSAGQRKTILKHSYSIRMKELLTILKKYVK